jgi:GMP synthase (glutamine-hydrolysing)
MNILVFQHVPHETPGLIGEYLHKKGIQFTIVEFWKPYKIPNMEDFDALIIMGGPMGVYEGPDKFPSKEDEINFIKNALDKIPIIGFCLGSQLIAHALGAEVRQNIVNGKIRKEIGYYNVDLTDEGLKDPIFKSFTTPTKVLQWHGDAFDLPAGAILLASSTDCANQAFRYGNKTYAMLFHNEFTPEMVNNLIVLDKDWIHKDFEFNEEKVGQEAGEYKSLMQKQCSMLMDNFLSLI